MALNLTLSQRLSLTFHTFPYFFHIPFISFQRTLVGPSGNEWERGNVWFPSFFWTNFSSFWASLVVVAAALWFLRGARHLHYPQKNFLSGENPQNGIQPSSQPGSLLEIFPTFHSPYFFHILFIFIQRTIVGPSGNEWERASTRFLLFVPQLCKEGNLFSSFFGRLRAAAYVSLEKLYIGVSFCQILFQNLIYLIEFLEYFFLKSRYARIVLYYSEVC